MNLQFNARYLLIKKGGENQIFKAANEKDALKSAIEVADFVASETLVAIPREEAIKLL